MPTYDRTARFEADYRRLSSAQRERVKDALRLSTDALRKWEAGGCEGDPRFPAKLGVKKMRGANCWELAWDDDGRATWSYGTPPRPDVRVHIDWYRIGTHDMYDDPI